MKKVVLIELQEYLRSKNLVNEKYISFYAHWASKFLAFSTSLRVSPGHGAKVVQFVTTMNN